MLKRWRDHIKVIISHELSCTMDYEFLTMVRLLIKNIIWVFCGICMKPFVKNYQNSGEITNGYFTVIMHLFKMSLLLVNFWHKILQIHFCKFSIHLIWHCVTFLKLPFCGYCYESMWCNMRNLTISLQEAFQKYI